MKGLIRGLGAGAVTCLVAWWVLRRFEYRQVYAPDPEWVSTGAETGVLPRDVWMEASDGTQIHGWFFATDSREDQPPPVALILHGNGGNITHRTELYKAFLELGFQVLAIDYRGYGKSGGRPTETGTYLDAQAAFRWLKDHSPGHVVVYGESLGGGVATELALREPVHALILQSTFTSVPDIGAELFPWLPTHWVASIRYDNRAKLPRVNVPILLLHSRTDSLIGFHHAEANFAAAREPKSLKELVGDHNDGMTLDAARFKAAIQEFLNGIGLRTARPSSG